MQIERAELIRVPLMMREPFEVSSLKFQYKDALLVRLFTTDGIIGYGESGAMPSPFYSPDYVDTAQAVLRDFILPRVVGENFGSVEDLEMTYQWIKGHAFAKIAVEGAYWHIIAQEQQVPLARVWGGELRRIEVGAILGIESRIPTLLRKVQAALDRGFRRIKIKIKPGYDIKPVAAIRERFGDILLMVDANSSYTLAPEHFRMMRELDQFNLRMIEQPLAEDNFIDHAQLQQQIQTPICLDESIHSFEDARTSIAIGACKIINIKPPRVGGFAISKRIAEYARANNQDVWCGGMYETGIGKGFNAHLCALMAFNLPADNPGSSAYYENDLLVQDDPIVIDPDGHITLPTGPGLGWSIDTAFIERQGIVERFDTAGA